MGNFTLKSHRRKKGKDMEKSQIKMKERLGREEKQAHKHWSKHLAKEEERDEESKTNGQNHKAFRIQKKREQKKVDDHSSKIRKDFHCEENKTKKGEKSRYVKCILKNHVALPPRKNSEKKKTRKLK